MTPLQARGSNGRRPTKKTMIWGDLTGKKKKKGLNGRAARQMTYLSLCIERSEGVER